MPPWWTETSDSSDADFSYFAVMGSVLLALLFVANATLEKSAPARASQFVGLPKAYEYKNYSTSLVATPAPAPDMSSDAVMAAAVVAAATPTEAAPARAAEIVPKKKKDVVFRQPQDDSREKNFAWSRNDNGSFGGRPFSGRF